MLKRSFIQRGSAVLTLTWKCSSDIGIDGDGKEIDGDDGGEEDEETGNGPASDEDDQFGVVEEIFDALQGHVCQTRDLTTKIKKYLDIIL